MADKKGRVKQLILKNLSEIIIYDLKTPVTKFVSINEVNITSDYSYCKVYVSNVESDKTDNVVAFLNNNASKIRTMLSKKLDIFKTPQLQFIADKEYEKANEISKKIDEALNKKPKTLKDVYGEDFKLKED